MCNNHDSKQASNRMRFRLVRLQVSWLKRRALRLGFLMTILILVAMAWVILPNIERSGLLYGLLVVVCLWLFACGCLLESKKKAQTNQPGLVSGVTGMNHGPLMKQDGEIVNAPAPTAWYHRRHLAATQNSTCAFTSTKLGPAFSL